MELIPRSEVLQRLQLNESELDAAVADGHLREFRLGKRVMYYSSEVEALAELFAIGKQ